MSVKSELPKQRNEMTEDDWIAYNKTRYRTWYNCAGVIVKNDNKVLLVQDKHTMKWSFPKGAAEVADMDNPITTAIRECYEEVGLIPSTDYTIESRKLHRFPYNTYYIFAIIHEGAEERARINDDEGHQVKWCTPYDIQMMWKDVNNGVRHYVKNY